MLEQKTDRYDEYSSLCVFFFLYISFSMKNFIDFRTIYLREFMSDMYLECRSTILGNLFI